MHIALIAPPWLPVPPAGYGGTESVLDRLARGLVAAGHRVLLCASGDSTCPVPRWSPLGESWPDAMGQTVPELYHALAAYEAAADAGVDIVHDHTLAVPFVGPRGGPPIVVTNHGPFDPMRRRLYAAAAERASVVAISHAQARTAAAGTVRAVIHHGLDVEGVPLGTGTGGYLAYLGRMCPEKGVVQAIEVAERAGLPLAIAAKCREPAERAFFEGVVRPRLRGAIEYVGEVAGGRKHAFLGDACALVNPIQWDEPFGLVMIEALAVGTPVLATPRGAAPEIVTPGLSGALSEDLGVLADAVGAVAALDRATCRRVVETRFSTTRMVDDHVALYTEVLADRTGAGRSLRAIPLGAPLFEELAPDAATRPDPAGRTPAVGGGSGARRTGAGR